MQLKIVVQKHLLSEGHSPTCNLLGFLLKEDLLSQDEKGFSHSFDEDKWTETVQIFLFLKMV